MKLTRPLTAAAVLTVAMLGAALAGVVAHASSSTKTITVTEKEYRMTVSNSKAAAGQVKFLVKNTGHMAHGFAIAGPGVKTKKTAMIKPGKSATLVVTLHSGKYSVWCPVPGHAALGMKAAVTVPAAVSTSGGGVTTTPAPTTTDSGGGGAWG